MLNFFSIFLCYPKIKAFLKGRQGKGISLTGNVCLGDWDEARINFLSVKVNFKNFINRSLKDSVFFLCYTGLCLLTSCSFFPEPSGRVDRFILNKPESTVQKRHTRYTLFVDTPTLNSSLQTNRVIFQKNAVSIDYISGVEWVDKIDSMLLESLIYTFQDGQFFKSVGSPLSDTSADYILKINVRAFGLYTENNKKYIKVIYNARLLNAENRNIFFEKLFESVSLYNWKDIEHFISSIDENHKQCVQKIEKWVYEKIH